MFSNSLTILAPSDPLLCQTNPLNPPYQGDCLEPPGMARVGLHKGGPGDPHLDYDTHPGRTSDSPDDEATLKKTGYASQSSGTSWPFFPSSPLGVTLSSVNE